MTTSNNTTIQKTPITLPAMIPTDEPPPLSLLLSAVGKLVIDVVDDAVVDTANVTVLSVGTTAEVGAIILLLDNIEAIGITDVVVALVDIIDVINPTVILLGIVDMVTVLSLVDAVGIISLVNTVDVEIVVSLVDVSDVEMLSMVNPIDVDIISLADTVDTGDIVLLAETTVEVDITDNVVLSGGIIVEIDKNKYSNDCNSRS